MSNIVPQILIPNQQQSQRKIDKNDMYINIEPNYSNQQNKKYHNQISTQQQTQSNFYVQPNISNKNEKAQVRINENKNTEIPNMNYNQNIYQQQENNYDNKETNHTKRNNSKSNNRKDVFTQAINNIPVSHEKIQSQSNIKSYPQSSNVTQIKGKTQTNIINEHQKRINRNQENANYLKQVKCENEVQHDIEFYKNQIKILIDDNSIKDAISKDLNEMLIENEDEPNEKLSNKIDEKLCLINEYETFIRRIKFNYEFYKSSDDKNSLKEIYQMLKRESFKFQSGLTIYTQRSKIINTINKNKCSIIVGETGSGKSTQLCQFLYDEKIFNHLESKNNLNFCILNEKERDNKTICVTQPRRLATKTLAIRVAQEMGAENNSIVFSRCGIRDIDKVSKVGSIEYCTDRIILEEIIKDPTLKKYSHLIIDEAHERNLFTDIILGMVKYALNQREDLKIIITSATMDEELFSKFFDNAPIIKVSGRLYPLKVHYLDRPLEDQDNYFDEICRRTQIIVKSINSSIEVHNDYSEYGHILIFCSGVDFISKLIIKMEQFKEQYCKIYALHGQVSQEEQNLVFEDTDQIKIILATRIAETSITIKDVKYVLDVGYDIESYYDPIKKLTTFQVNSITQSSANQRAGRGCRTAPGVCFRLFTEEYFENMMPFKVAEIKRSNLSIVSLKLKQFNIGNIKSFSFIERPDVEALDNSIQELILLGALNENEEITDLGREMADLPTDPWLSKIIIEGSNRNCQDEVMRIISLLQTNNSIFYVYHKDKSAIDELDKIKMEYTDEHGDLIMLLNVFNGAYGFLTSDKSSKRTMINYCREKKINIKTMTTAVSFYNDLKHALKGKNIISKILDDKTKKMVNEGRNKTVKLSAEDMLNEYSKRVNITENKIINSESGDILKFLENLGGKVNSYKGEDDRKINIIKCFLSSYFQNLCIYSDNENIGYTLLRELIPLKIQNTSCLCLAQNFPKWIFCFEIMKNSFHNSTKLASKCDIKWIEEVVPKKFLEYYSIAEYDKNPLYNTLELLTLPSLFLKAIKNPEASNVKRLAPFLEEHKIAAKVDLEKSIAMFWTLEDKAKIKNLWNDFYKQYQGDYSFFVREHIYSKDKKFIIGAGLGITDIVDKDDFIRINCTISSKFINNESEFYKSFSGLNYSEQIFRIKKIDRPNLKDLNEFQITFKKAEHAKASLTYLKRLINGYKLFDKSLIFEIECSKNLEVDQAFKDRFINANVKFFYPVGFSELRGMIRSHTITLSNIRKTAEKNGTQLIFDPHINTEFGTQMGKLFFKGLKLNEDEFDVLTFLEASVKHDNIKIFRKKEIDQTFDQNLPLNSSEKINYYTYYSEIKKRTKYANSIEEFITIMKDCYDTDLNSFNVEFDQMKKQNTDLQNPDVCLKEISFNVNHIKDVEYFINKFNKKLCILGDGKLTIVVAFKARLYVLRSKYIQIKKLIEDMKNKFLKQYTGMQIILPRLEFNKEDKTLSDRITLISNYGKDELIQVKTQFVEILNGKLVSEYDYHKLLVLFEGNNKLKLISFQREYECYIEHNEELREIRIIGDPDKFAKSIPELLKIVDSSKIHVKMIDYSGKNISKLMKNKSESKKGLENNFKSIINIDLRNKKISIYGKENDIKSCHDEIIKIIANSNSNLENRKLQDCLICAGDIANGFRLMSCEHIFCYSCLEEYLMQSKNEIANFPINCPLSNCKTPICIGDLKYIIKEKEIKKMYEIALDKFILSNKDRFTYCPVTHCKNILIFTEDIKSTCTDCGFITCKKCLSDYHPGLTCNQIVANNKLFNQLGLKACPFCGMLVEKNIGCNNVRCKCGKNFCWVCLEKTGTEQLTYSHLQRVHGSFV